MASLFWAPHMMKVWSVCQFFFLNYLNQTYSFTGDPPAPEEIFTAFPIGETKITLKSGYGKYLGIDKNGIVVGRSDAVSALEQWEPVFEEGKLALVAANSKFVSVSPDDDGLVAHSITAGPEQILKIRCNKEFEEIDPKRKKTPEEETGSVEQIEINYV